MNYIMDIFDEDLKQAAYALENEMMSQLYLNQWELAIGVHYFTVMPSTIALEYCRDYSPEQGAVGYIPFQWKGYNIRIFSYNMV